MGLFDKAKKSDSIYASLTTKEQIMEMVDAGELKTVYLMPVVFGGQESEKNTVYVPKAAAMIKTQSDGMVEELLMENIINNYVCKPLYSGNSLVPDKFEIVGSKSGEVVFVQSVNIW